jgi:hypothetical protein
VKRSRWNELLGIPNEVKLPNLYQILGLEEQAFSADAVEPAFKERMQRVQSLKSTRHKEFLEFVKGELRRGLRVLGSAEEKKAYDRELADERRDELARLLAPVLATGALFPAAERSIVATAVLELGLSETEASAIIDDELERSGAARGDAAVVGGVAEGLTREAAAELLRAQADRLARLAADAEARAIEAEKIAASPEPLLIPSSTETVKLKKKKKKKTRATQKVPAEQTFCASCHATIPERWKKTGEAERVGARLLCSHCAAPVRAGKACAACTRVFQAGEKTVAGGGSKRLCEICARGAQRLKSCAGCAVFLPKVLFDRGEVVHRDGKLWCRECGTAKSAGS